ncbi:MAG: radical SAM family heme chaperone HemW [Pseudomonadota bacterium]|nr:radical SAM family heme chaperone HemW [Pseudomonadota bacterium]
MSPKLSPLAVYVHFPWCMRKCPYCDFNSHAVRGEIPERAYIDALLRDLEYEQSSAPGLALAPALGRRVGSVFLGGGTPSLFSVAAIGRLMEAITRGPGLEEGAEITLEANPGTAEQERFAGYRAAGVNRLSLGAQSFNASALEKLGRIHGARESRAAFTAARQAGFDNINFDLMYALPGQTLDAARRDLQTAAGLAPEHISLYQLTIEPNTRFAADPPELPDHDTAAAMQDALFEELDRAGYRQYEVSAHARPDRESRHNLNYWRFGDYIGIGAGAHGKLTGPRGVERYWKQRNPERYMELAGQQGACGGPSRPGAVDLRFEFLMNALRLKHGFRLADYEERTGLSAASLSAELVPLAEEGWLELDAEKVRASDHGYRYLDELLQKLLP